MPEWVATYHGTTVAELETAAGSVNLWMSTDQMQSWRKLDQAPSGQLFINPSTGDLLMLGGGNGNQELDLRIQRSGPALDLVPYAPELLCRVPARVVLRGGSILAYLREFDSNVHQGYVHVHDG